jgi:hypothetical protein
MKCNCFINFFYEPGKIATIDFLLRRTLVQQQFYSTFYSAKFLTPNP